MDLTPDLVSESRVISLDVHAKTFKCADGRVHHFADVAQHLHREVMIGAKVVLYTGFNEKTGVRSWLTLVEFR